jgi:prepilin-type N-terminal cleavage/methylation domain-containing protein
MNSTPWHRHTRVGAGAVPVRPTTRAFSLVEIMVVIALLSVIILGLLLMFNQTQRAFQAGLAQVDVQEGGRTLVEMIARELAQTTPTYKQRIFNNPPRYVVNFSASFSSSAPLIQQLPGPTALADGDPNVRTNVLTDLFFMQKENLKWSGVGYVVRNSDGAGNLVTTDSIGALYRFETNYTDRQFDTNPGWFYRDFTASAGSESRMNRIVDGVVHFKIRTYDRDGVWQMDNVPNDAGNLKSEIWLSGLKGPAVAKGEVTLAAFYSNAVPGFVEIELGILESRVAKRARAISDPGARRLFLENQAARVHVFRTRVPIRNVDPLAYQ